MDPEPSLVFIVFQSITSVQSGQLWFSVIIFIVLVVCSGLISAAEAAYLSLGAKDIKELEEQNNKSSKRVLALHDKPRFLSVTILIFNNFINVAIVIAIDIIIRILIGTNTLMSIGLWLHDHVMYGFATPETISSVFHFLITILVVTFILVIFGAAIPKIYATISRHKIVHFMSRPLALLMWLFTPLSKIMVGWSSKLEKKLAISNNQNLTTKEGIDAAIDLTMTNDTPTAAQEADILKGIVNFGDTSAKQIMHSRMDIVYIDIKDTFKTVMKVVKESGYSRLPVCQDDLDNIVGILYVKDLLAFIEEGDHFDWQKLIRSSTLFIPESKKIDELLREFQLKRIHMAIIVDEYGGTAGIATLEDIMEEVVGDIKDEFDQEEDVQYIKISDNNYIFEGKTLLNDVSRIIGFNPGYFDDVRGDSDSIAGLILENIGTLPNSEKEISINDITLKVISVTKRRIEKISLFIHAENQ